MVTVDNCVSEKEEDAIIEELKERKKPLPTVKLKLCSLNAIEWLINWLIRAARRGWAYTAIAVTLDPQDSGEKDT